MRILHVNIKDTLGAGIAAHRLHFGLRKMGVDSLYLVKDKTIDDPNIISVIKNKADWYKSEIYAKLERLPLRNYKHKKEALFSTSLYSNNYIREINSLNPDIVHLHWINRGFFKLSQIKKINAPVVFSLHDMWLFTGGCHYSSNCTKYRQHCGNCPILGSDWEKDLSYELFDKKLRVFEEKKNLYLIGLSQWMAECASSSPLIDKNHVFQLPNCIDLEQYKPLNKLNCRKELNLPVDKKLILFGAMSSTSDPRKGFEKLISILQIIDSPNYELVVFGAGAVPEIQKLKMKTSFMGVISSPQKMIELYSSADITIVPSIEENLSNIIMESMACGTPVAAFEIGGNPDMVKHKNTGVLAPAFDTSVLAQYIVEILNDDDYQNQLSKNAIELVKNNFEEGIVASRYINFYHKILTNK